MRPETIAILRALAKRHGGDDLQVLWEDIKNSARDEFLSAIAPPEKKGRARKTGPAPKKRPKSSDAVASMSSEEARIAYTFKKHFKLDGLAGVNKLIDLLIKSGFHKEDLPTASDDLERWIEATINRVPSGLVMELSRSGK